MTKEEVAWQKVIVVEGKAEIRDLTIRTNLYTFEIVSESWSEVVINLAFFPGWKVWVNDKEVELKLDDGRVGLSFDPGEYKVILKFTNTSVRTWADLVSLTTLVLAGFSMIKLSYGRARFGFV